MVLMKRLPGHEANGSFDGKSAQLMLDEAPDRQTSGLASQRESSFTGTASRLVSLRLRLRGSLPLIPVEA